MEHYEKGENIEEEFIKNKLPIPNLPSDFLWMIVTGGTKIHNVLNFAKKALKNKEAKHIVWSASGGGVTKAITCAEIIKRDNKELYQVTNLCQRKVEEYWDPLLKDLEPIIVTRKIPAIHILLTPDPVDSSVLGSQAPNDPNAFWKEKTRNNRSNNKQNSQNVLSNVASGSKAVINDFDEAQEKHAKLNNHQSKKQRNRPGKPYVRPKKENVPKKSTNTK